MQKGNGVRFEKDEQEQGQNQSDRQEKIRPVCSEFSLDLLLDLY